MVKPDVPPVPRETGQGDAPLPRWQEHDEKVTSHDEGKQTDGGET